MNPLLKLISAFALLVLAFVFTFVMPGSGLEETVITLAASIFGTAFMASWRESYNLVKGWMKSKTILGVLMVVIPIIFLSLRAYFGWEVHPYLVTASIVMISLGGGVNIIGIFLAKKKYDDQLAEIIDRPKDTKDTFTRGGGL